MPLSRSVAGELRTELRPHTFRYGRLFEALVIQEIVRLNDYVDAQYRMFHWRTNIGTEVDLILSRGPSDAPRAIEIESDNAPTAEDLKGLRLFAEDHPHAKLYCLCQTPSKYTLGDISVLPWREGVNIVLGELG